MNDMIFKDQVLMITGGTGSFGNTLLNRFLETDVKEIRIFSRDEKKQEDLRNQLKSNKLRFIIGDVRDRDSLFLASKGVDFVFHAAALKQVPSCEFHPLEAVKTNILGTENVLDIASASGVKKVVVLSTDKAVYPINAMGLSKAMAEKLVLARSRCQLPGQTVFCGTRYGNVMGSRGSVIPLFVNQLKAGLPITITDPNMTRFLMSMDDAVDLVLYAFNTASQGDIFVQKSPACTIKDLGQALINLFNKNYGIRIIGTRHGEKLYESLISREEMAKAKDLGSYYRIPADERDLNYSYYITEGSEEVSNYQDYTSHNTRRLKVLEIEDLLINLPFIKESLQCVK